jgi:hypothetical protein
VFKGKSLVALTASSLLSLSSAVDCKFLLEAHWKHQMAKGACHETDTDLALWRCVLWDLKACRAGVCPQTNYDGTNWDVDTAASRFSGASLCDGWWAVVWAFKGDSDHFANGLALPHWTKPQPCPWCPADRTADLWTDFRADAQWKLRSWQPDNWRNNALSPHPLFTVPHFSICNVALDVLHVMMGVGSHICGNVLHTLCYSTMRGAAAENCAEIWAMVQQWYAENKEATQLSKLPLACFCNPRAPWVRYPLSSTKAKETEYLALALGTVWNQHCDHQDLHDQSVAAVLEHCATIYTTARLHEGGFQLSTAQWRSLTQAIDQMLLHYTALGNHCAARGVRRWNVVIKFHLLWHWGQQARLLHPGRTACYMDEHFCGVVANIVKSSTSGRRIERVGETLMFKWQCGVALNDNAATADGGATVACPAAR